MYVSIHLKPDTQPSTQVAAHSLPTRGDGYIRLTLLDTNQARNELSIHGRPDQLRALARLFDDAADEIERAHAALPAVPAGREQPQPRLPRLPH